MRLKAGVIIGGVAPELAFVMPAVTAVAEQYLGGLVVTSVADGTHREGSLHYQGRAIDIRTRNARDDIDRQRAALELQACLGDQFDVVLEATHIHIEYDPE